MVRSQVTRGSRRSSFCEFPAWLAAEMVESCHSDGKASGLAATLEQIREAGVVGAGGAGFPTHAKLAGGAGTPPGDKPPGDRPAVDTLVINAAECEPLLHKDKEILRSRAQM